MPKPPLARKLSWNDSEAVLIRGNLPDEECLRLAAELLNLDEADAATLKADPPRWWRWRPDYTGEFDVRLHLTSPGRGAFLGRLVR